MKSSKTLRPSYGSSDRRNTDRRNGKREKAAKLDRKSSRGMIYENEELRLRTININAEVERGQSDIKRLRRENEHLRREIWTLRDECDRLNKRFKAKLQEYEHGGCSARGSGGSCGARHSGHCDGPHSNCNSDDSDSCDTCKGNDDQCSDDCCAGGSCSQLPEKQPIVEEPIENIDTASQQSQQFAGASIVSSAGGEVPQSLHTAFDHLSVVSEETLSNSELQAPTQLEPLQIYTPDSNGSQITLPSLVGPLTPLTPIEQVANQLNDLQAVVPPLSYFENVVQQHMGSTIGNSPLSPTTAKVVRHTNGWDYNLQSPFAHRKFPANSPPSPPTIATSSPQSSLSTFGPSVSIEKPALIASTATNTNASAIETVAITTMPTNVPATAIHGSPKNFFAPLKPRLKINTSLANKTLVAATVPTVPPSSVASAIAGTTGTATAAVTNAYNSVGHNCDPPDIYVANALATPYQRQQVMPPPLPQRSSSSQVSPRPRTRVQQQRQNLQLQEEYHQQHQQRHHQQLHQQPPKCIVNVTLAVDDETSDVDAAAAAAADAAARGAAVRANGGSSVSPTKRAETPINDKHEHEHLLTVRTEAFTTKTLTITTKTTTLPTPTLTLTPTQAAKKETENVDIRNSNTLLTQLNEPIYATAQKGNKLISAPAVTQPLMTTTIVGESSSSTGSTKLTSIERTAMSSPTTTPKSTATKATITTTTVDSQSQTDSVNLETILNDIETISEDILAIQMAKKKLRDNQTDTAEISNKPLQEADKDKKPYRSEMNLMLQYDGANPTITPSKPSLATQTSLDSSNGSNGRGNGFLDREHTDSPAPHMPAPMAPFPDKRTYLGFDQLNSTVNAGIRAQKPPLPPSQVNTSTGMSSLMGTPTKPSPPAPPARMFPPPLNIRCTGVARGTPVATPQAPDGIEKATQVPYMAGLAPNKSQLYSAMAQAAAKRAHLYTKAAPNNGSPDREAAAGTPENGLDSPAGPEDAGNTEAARRKARRVSIICGETSNPATPDHTPNQPFSRSQAQNVNTTNASSVVATSSTIHTTNSNNSTNTTNTTTTHPTAAGSCTDLPSVLINPALKSLKQTSHSTPNTPHAAHRRCNSNSMLVNGVELTTQSAHNSPQHHPTQQQTAPLVNNSCSNLLAAQQRKQSQDSTRDLAAAAALMARSKCSRRHSDGTVVSTTQRGGGAGGHHHHHHHHHHQHTASMLSNNPHHSHHSRQDSNHETCTSLSDRNSGSLASSRESSTSFSVRSHRRKISISSHTGGKIPWCGCWGNGCL